MLARRLIATDVRSYICVTLRSSKFATDSDSQFYDDGKSQRAVRELKQWREPPPMETSKLQAFQMPVKKGQPLRLRRKPMFLEPMEMRNWWRSKVTEYEKFEQRFIVERHRTLGCDLAAAHFLVHRGGRVKFVNRDDWYDAESVDKLPTKFDPDWQLTRVDASGCKQLISVGLENFVNLGRVDWASFAGNKNFDDWYLDRVTAQMPNLEYLDVSECESLTERGLGSLYRLYRLKHLVITDWEKLASFELTCVMLQDLNTDLKIDMKEPEKGKTKKK